MAQQTQDTPFFYFLVSEWIAGLPRPDRKERNIFQLDVVKVVFLFHLFRDIF
jgi:hypothetical protein